MTVSLHLKLCLLCFSPRFFCKSLTGDDRSTLEIPGSSYRMEMSREYKPCTPCSEWKSKQETSGMVIQQQFLFLA